MTLLNFLLFHSGFELERPKARVEKKRVSERVSPRVMHIIRDSFFSAKDIIVQVNPEENNKNVNRKDKDGSLM